MSERKFSLEQLEQDGWECLTSYGQHAVVTRMKRQETLLVEVVGAAKENWFMCGLDGDGQLVNLPRKVKVTLWHLPNGVCYAQVGDGQIPGGSIRGETKEFEVPE